MRKPFINAGQRPRRQNIFVTEHRVQRVCNKTTPSVRVVFTENGGFFFFMRFGDARNKLPVDSDSATEPLCSATQPGSRCRS